MSVGGDRSTATQKGAGAVKQMLTQRDQDIDNAHRIVAAMFPESDERLGAMRMRAVIELVLVYAEEAHRARTEAGL